MKTDKFHLSIIKEKRCYALAILLLPMLVFAQTHTIQGVVVGKDNLPVAYASVVLMSGDKAVTGGITDTAGHFLLKGEFSGEYHLQTSFIGCKTDMQKLTCGSLTAVDVGRIILEQDIVFLEGITISQDALEKSVSIEKTSLTPAGSATAATGSVLELLRMSSAVNVDFNNTVSIHGNSSVLILVDGVPTTLDGLGNIPAANVQTIDIISSPDVKYDAEGTGGIINIISKKQTVNAFHAMASFNYGFLGMVNGNFAINYNKGRWGIRVNYNGKYERDLIESELHRQFVANGNSIDQLIHADKITGNQVLGINLNFKATPNDILNLDVKAMLPRMNNVQDFNNRYVSDSTARDLQRRTDITFDREMVEGALAYKHLFEHKKQEIDILASISSITGHRPSYYYERDSMVQRSVSGGHPLVAAIQADYGIQLGRGRFETGVKMTVRGNNIDHKFYEYDPAADEWNHAWSLSNDLKHREYIPALYAMYSGKAGRKELGEFPKLTYKAGFRFEYGYVTLRSQKEQLYAHNQSFIFAPQFSLIYNVNMNWTLHFGLSRRISRPTYPQLNPYINLIDNQTYETGNIRLLPEKVNKLDFGYTVFDIKNIVKVNGSAYCDFTQDHITQIATLADDILLMTYINGRWNLTAGIDHNLRIKPIVWMDIDIATNTYYSHSVGEYKGMEILNHGWTNNSNISLTFKPIRGMNLQLQYFVVTPQYFAQFTTKTIHYCNIGIKQTFWKNRITVSALLTDVFNTRRWDIYADNTIYSLVNTSKNRSRMFWLGVTFNINSFKPQAGKKQQEEDRNMIRIGE